MALRAWRCGDPSAEERLIELVYADIHRMAKRFLQGERPGHTLQTTALVHEVYLRLIDQREVDWRSRNQFFAICARVMRRILVDHVRARRRVKRGGELERVLLDDLDDATNLAVERPDELAAVDEALTALTEIDRQKAAVVELRFFGGFSVEETARILGVSVPTVGRYWRLARAWLYREIYGEEAREPRSPP